MAPVKQAAQVAVLVDELVLFQYAIDPARHRHAGFGHHARGITAFDPFKVHTPCCREMAKGTFCDAVITWQRIGVTTYIGNALHVIVATENIGTSTALANIAQSKLQDTRCPHHGVTNGVLGVAHAPNQGTGTVFSHGFGNVEAGCFVNAAGLQHLVRCPFGHDVFLDLFHAPHTVVDKLLVFPTVLEHMVEHAKQKWDVRSRANADVLVCFGCCAREPWINHNHLCALFLRVQHMHQ